MKRFIALMLSMILLAAGSCVSEVSDIPDIPEYGMPVYEIAKPLYEILLSCDSFYNFDGVPDEEFAREAVCRLIKMQTTACELLTFEDAYSMLFSEGEYVYALDTEAYPSALPVNIEIDGAIESGTGTIIVSLRVEKDFGFGMEFWGYVDIHILPDETAPFYARVTRVFIPE